MDILDYHRRSKHHPGRYAPGPGQMDWANQPEPFRSYAGAPWLRLPLGADALTTPYSTLRAGDLPQPAPFDADHVAALLELSLGLSAWKEYLGTRWALRCNPSSGNLHPTEGYLVTPPLPGLSAGTWHYLSRDHVLEQRAVLSAEAWPGGEGVLLALNSIVWREAWKYGLRAFRYCQHDCGHAVAAVALAAGVLGWCARLLGGASDEAIAALTGIDRLDDIDDAERESPEALLWISAGGPAPDPGDLARALGKVPWQGSANRLSADHASWPDVARAQAMTRQPSTLYPPWTPPPRPAPAAAALDLRGARVIRQRRSAVAFDGVTAMSDGAFLALLDATLPRPATPPWTAWPWPPAVHLLLFVHRVDGLEPGLYLLPRDPAALPALRAAMRPDWLWQGVGPAHLGLHLLLPQDVRAVARFVSCHQEIAADSCFALAMLADFDGVAAEPWRYRRLFWECGMIGQVLYLEAEAAGLRGTGIGCFFDDEVHGLLGLEGGRWQSLYHFTVGGAVEDGRLMMRPPYGPLQRRTEHASDE